jgi:hypothetical protein
MTDTRMNSLHDLIERFRGRKAESLNLDFSDHVEALSWPCPM